MYNTGICDLKVNRFIFITRMFSHFRIKLQLQSLFVDGVDGVNGVDRCYMY